MACRLWVDYRMWVVAAILVGSSLRLSAGGSAPQVRVPDLENRLVAPFQAPAGTKAIVLLFISVDCPLSSRYAPEIRRLYDTFAPKGVIFWLIYANPADSPDAIRNDLKAFAYPARALRDANHVLVKLTKATVAPEAAVYDRQGRLLYRGRIDDRYVSLGLERPVPTKHDLEETLAATLTGKPKPQPTTQAVGCLLADFLR